MKINELFDYDFVKGDFTNLSKFNFYGVYVIYDNKEEIVYIGSAYARTIKTRLGQYKSATDTGNTLAKSIACKKYNCKSKDLTEDQKKEAVKDILQFKIMAIKHEDLEYKLIAKAKPRYNNCGKKEV